MARIENGSFHSEIDRDIALQLADTIQGNERKSLITPGIRDSALRSLHALVPVTDEHGRRWIAGQQLGPGIEKWIASRLDSPEIDIAAPDGAWGRLPEPVKKQLTLYGTGLRMELTTSCAVACSFCTFADKGKIGAKASFDSVREVMRYFIDNQPGAGPHRTDWLYNGTDPFDVKWQHPYIERDYRDIAEAHLDLSRSRGKRYLGTSTAVPVGEEFRVLAFMDHTLDGISRAPHSANRLSRTKANAARVDHIYAVLQGSNPTGLPRLAVNLVDVPAKRGRAWDRREAITGWDILGPNCADAAIIGVNGVRAIVMQGGSSERPLGELRWPIETADSDGLRRYVIPNLYAKPVKVQDHNASSLYPDIQVTNLIVDEQGSVHSRTVETWHNDPHRALLRVVSALEWYRDTIKAGKMDKLTAQQDFVAQFGDSIAALRKHLETGADNASMQVALGMAAAAGFTEAWLPHGSN